MTYKTQPGTLPHRVVEFLKTKPSGFEISTADLAEAMDFDAKSIVQCLVHPRQHGALAVRTPPGSRTFMWRLGDGTPAKSSAEQVAHDARVEASFTSHKSRQPRPVNGQPFNAAAYIDGSLIVVGVQVRQDGAVVLDPDQTRQLRRLIAWMPA